MKENEKWYLKYFCSLFEELVHLEHTFPVGEMQLRVAEFCYCFCLYNRTHSFNFPLVAQKSTRVAQVLEKYDGGASEAGSKVWDWSMGSL